VKRLVVAGRFANAMDQERSQTTILYAAAQRGHHEIVAHLLSEGAKPGLARSNGSTPLHTGAWHGHDGVVRVLLQQPGGVKELHRPNQEGDQPIHAVARRGHLEVLNSLLRAGARLDTLGRSARAQPPLSSRASTSVPGV
jgi:ankyrin repeat protein